LYNFEVFLAKNFADRENNLKSYVAQYYIMAVDGVVVLFSYK